MNNFFPMQILEFLSNFFFMNIIFALVKNFSFMNNFAFMNTFAFMNIPKKSTAAKSSPTQSVDDV